jgi:hypothetical protein
MVFALNMPFLSAWYKKVESLSASREWAIKLSVLGVLGAVFAVWVKQVYMQDKIAYNSIHSYYGIIPLIAYLFLRNISVTLRSYYLHTLHTFGTVTLESYLLQYHIWLADNAGMLLNIIPGYPVLNYTVASCLHVFCAFQIFHATTKLRSILVPSDVGVAMCNLALMLAAVAAACFASIVILRYNVHVGVLAAIVGAIAAMAAQFLLQWHNETHVMLKLAGTYRSTEALNSKPMLVLFGFVIVFGGFFLLHAQDFAPKSGFPVALEANAVAPVSLLELENSASAHSGLALFADSFAMGSVKGFVIGSLAQPWHGLVAVLGILLCLALNDPLFGLARLAQAIFGPSGQKSISWEEAYGPLLEKLGERKRDRDAESVETQPLVAEASRAAGSY